MIRAFSSAFVTTRISKGWRPLEVGAESRPRRRFRSTLTSGTARVGSIFLWHSASRAAPSGPCRPSQGGRAGRSRQRPRRRRGSLHHGLVADRVDVGIELEAFEHPPRAIQRGDRPCCRAPARAPRPPPSPGGRAPRATARAGSPRWPPPRRGPWHPPRRAPWRPPRGAPDAPRPSEAGPADGAAGALGSATPAPPPPRPPPAPGRAPRTAPSRTRPSRRPRAPRRMPWPLGSRAAPRDCRRARPGRGWRPPA